MISPVRESGVGFFSSIVEILKEDFSPLVPRNGVPFTREAGARLLLYLSFLLFVAGLLFSRIDFFESTRPDVFFPQQKEQREKPVLEKTI